MRRRAVFLGGSSIAVASLAGCLGGCNSLFGYQGDRERVQFERRTSEYVLVVRNDLTERVEAAVTVTDAAGETDAETVSVEPNNTAQATGLFERDAGPYSVSVSANGETTERTLEPGGSPDDEFRYTISSAGFDFQAGYRPAPELVISNELDERVDVRVAVDRCSNGRHVYDVVAVPPDETASYVGFSRKQRSTALLSKLWAQPNR